MTETACGTSGSNGISVLCAQFCCEPTTALKWAETQVSNFAYILFLVSLLGLKSNFLTDYNSSITNYVQKINEGFYFT